MKEHQNALGGKVAVVTGGSRGIGKAVCMAFAKSGAGVAFLYAGNTEKAEETLGELKSSGANARGYRCSVADGAAVKKTFAQIIKDFGKIDILVNNAGITRDKLAILMSEDDFMAVIDVNLKGAFHCIKSALPAMLKRGGGKIINISSVSGLFGNPGQLTTRLPKRGFWGSPKRWRRNTPEKASPATPSPRVLWKQT